jgi:DNA (cytosine-5)-methyltransferase 1
MVAFGEYVDDGTASAMKARDYKDATDLVAQPIPLDMRNAGRDPEKHDEMNRQGVGVGEPGDPAHTVTSAFVHAVAQPIIGGVDYENNAHGPDDVTGPLLKGSPTGGGRPLPAIALQSMAVAQPIVAMRESGLGYWMEDTVAGTLDANMGMSGHANRPAVMTVPQAVAVRRLTPVECERLQGFPDGYTNIPWRKKDESPDGPRYKALGNSWAVPVVAWIGKRIQGQINAA